jgi:hypothetical protein
LLRSVLYFIAILFALTGAAQSSVLSTGKWFKISVKADGIYQIDYALLKSLGADPDKINPKTIRLFGYSNGMLPQANSASRQKDLKEIAITVLGEDDNKFNKGDRILFFGQGPDVHYYVPSKETFWYENHLYTDKNFYFITFGGDAGKRITQQESLAGTFPVINQYFDFAQFEEDKVNILHSGREWFGQELGSQTEATVQFEMAGVAENSPIKLISKVMGRFYSPCTFNIFYNNVQVGVQEVATVANSTYAAKGRMKSDTLSFNSSAVNATGSTHRVKYQFIKTGAENSVGFLDNFLVSLKRQIALYGSQTVISLTDGLNRSQSAIEIQSAVDPHVWDVTDPFLVKDQAHTYTNGKAAFIQNTNPLKRIAVFNGSVAMAIPTGEGSVSNQNLQAINSPDLLIIAHPDFTNEASRLAAHRLSHDGLNAMVVSPAQIYNEYSGGKQDVSALRDFVRDVYTQSSSGLKYVLLFGRGSYDYKNRNEGNTNFVPVYESRNSLAPLETYSSDDFYGFLEEHEGDWSETDSFDHTLDVGVGRLPVRTTEEAVAIVDKLIEFDTNPKAKGQWKTNIVFTADDGDYNIHQSQADQLATYIENSNAGLHAKKIYLDLFSQQQKSFGQISVDATNTLFRAFHEGALIINFTGHGSEQQWMQERMLDPISVAALENRYRYPFLITATCEFGRNDDPMLISSAEKILLKKNAGSIGLVTTSRPVNSSTNFEINSDFYHSFLNDNTSKGKPIGSVFKVTKNKGNLGVANRNFSLLADPSMTVGPPVNGIHITQLVNQQGESALKGLTKYTVSGEVRKSGLTQTGFNGEAEVRIFNVPDTLLTRGDENPVFQFTENIDLIFQGKAVVENGSFQTDFIVPELKEGAASTGRIIVYALSSGENHDEATGDYEVMISNTNSSLIDSSPPIVKLFINDTTFIDGGIANESPYLIAQLHDDSGIDVSGYESTSIKATLDGDTTFNLTTYFQTDINSFQKGKIKFQMFDLSEGNHQIEFEAFDIAGNKATATVDFAVAKQKHLEVGDLTGWPNPFAEKVKIGFSHNRSGEDLQGTIVITNTFGKPIRAVEFASPASLFSTEIMEWDGTDSSGSKVVPGVYILRLLVRSLVDNSKSEAFAKLILSN